MQHFDLLDAYAECAARLEGHMYGLERMNVLTDRNVIVYLIKNFTKLEPTIKKIRASDGRVYNNMYYVKNTIYLAQRMENRILAISEGKESEMRFNFQRLSVGELVLHNNQPAFRMVWEDIAYGLDGQNLGAIKRPSFGQFDPSDSVIEYKGVYYALKHDRRQYNMCHYTSGYIVTLYRVGNVDVCAIYNPFELNERVKNQPLVEFWSLGVPDAIRSPQICGANGLVYVVTNTVTMIDLKARRVIWHFSHEKNHMPWIQAPWEFPEDARVKPDGNLLVKSGGEIFEVQV